MTCVFVFVGRISLEKGVDLIFSAADQLVQEGFTDFIIEFVGSGTLVDTLTAHPLYRTHLVYYGRLPKEKTMAIMSKATYTLMPSRFLETFGLVALDSLALGVPVVAEKKGGLIPFVIDDSLGIDSAHPLVARMKELMHIPSSSLRQKALEVASLYTPSRRVDRFGQLSKNCKKLLLVSDYAVDIGGIENYLLQVQMLLTSHGIENNLIGKTTQVTGRWRKLDLLVAGLNLGGVRRLWKTLKKKQVDLVWLHSVQRRWGRVSAAYLLFTKQQPVWCMYHDGGLLHPFPSRVYSIEQLDRAKSFRGYLQEGRQQLGITKWLCGGWVLVVAKYINSAWMFYRLGKVVDLHLVPSAYLIPYVQHKLPRTSQVKEFPHFVSHARDV